MPAAGVGLPQDPGFTPPRLTTTADFLAFPSQALFPISLNYNSPLCESESLREAARALPDAKFEAHISATVGSPGPVLSGIMPRNYHHGLGQPDMYMIWVVSGNERVPAPTLK